MLLLLTSAAGREHSCHGARYRATMPGLAPQDTDSNPDRVNHSTAHTLLGFKINDTFNYSHVFRKEVEISKFLSLFVCMAAGKKNQSAEAT